MTDVPPGHEPEQPPPPPGWGQPPPGPPVYPQQPYQQVGYGYTYGQYAEYAGFWIRFAAAVIDSLVLIVPSIVLIAIAGNGFTVSSSSGYNPQVNGVVNLISTLIGVAYFASLEGGENGQTIGKRLCSIRVVDATTGQAGIGIGRGIGRYFARWLSQIVLLLGYLWMLWDPRKQTWHDKLARTIVVKA